MKWKGHARSGCIVMPKGFDIRNGLYDREACDMAQGPCICGAWHSREDWIRRQDPMWKPTKSQVAEFKRLVKQVDAAEKARP